MAERAARRAVLVVDRKPVRGLLDPHALESALRPGTHRAQRRTGVDAPRIAPIIAERDAQLLVMASYLPATYALVTKTVAIFPGNATVGKPTHQALIVLYDAEDGSVLAVMDGTHITAARTAAASALATRLLARDDATILAVLGTGVPARAHAIALAKVRDFAEIRIAGRDERRTQSLAAALDRELATPVLACHGFERAVTEAHVVCLATHAAGPLVCRGWLTEGAHVTSVGLNPAGSEIGADIVHDALVTVESRASALADPPAGARELRDSSREPADVVELGELLAGSRVGRRDAKQLTLYKAVGVAVEDAAAAVLVYAAARRCGAGQTVAL